MDQLWARADRQSAGRAADLEVKGRKLAVPQASMGVARFSFAELCEQPLGTLDYLALAHKFHTVMIDGIPVLAPAQRDVARRFVNLIDTLYDNRVCLVASAAAEPEGLYPAGDMQFLFERTASRLIEMRSEGYLAARTSASARRAGLKCVRRTPRGPRPRGLGRGSRVAEPAIEASSVRTGAEAADQPLQQAAVVVVVDLEAVAVGGDEGARRAIRRQTASIWRNLRARSGACCSATIRLAISWPW